MKLLLLLCFPVFAQTYELCAIKSDSTDTMIIKANIQATIAFPNIQVEDLNKYYSIDSLINTNKERTDDR